MSVPVLNNPTNLICMPCSVLPSIRAQGAAFDAPEGRNHVGSFEQPFVEGPQAVVDGPVPGHFRQPPDSLSKDQFKSAKILPLHAGSTSPEAKAFVDQIAQLVIEQELSAGIRQRRRRQKGLEKLEKALGTIIGGLLWNWGATQPRPSFRSLKTNAFTGEPVGADVFKGTLHALLELRLVHKHEGRRTRHSDSFSARYWPTESLLRLADGHSITPPTLRRHFKLNPPKKAPRVLQPLRLMGPKVPNRKRVTLFFDPASPEAVQLIQQIEVMNHLAGETDVQGCLPPRWKRTFTLDWHHHGRWYAAGGEGNYQQFSQADRLQIQINEESVVEVDISASHLTLLHGMMGLPAPEGDAYLIESFPRDVAKAWINATIGKGSPVKRWAKRAREQFGPNTSWSAKKVGAAVLARYPFLAAPDNVICSNDSLQERRKLLPLRLMAIEASIMTQAMLDLAAQGVLALPMHDGLIVPASAKQAAQAAILAAGQRFAHSKLKLKVDAP
ncbi:hypothetical protein [Teichococcus vastitatis]|uniref:Uncharacterized protein n=1 Tax=Teichococcus vastitatis TaxID=2307076 RepID=A0ABS9W0C2_9PROT|nr:hypothetical protein [Pseudoroseomonas vastitatis]MCI0752748.1 hypothetical protein [Pseudoroseomonas vastitatis]